GKCRLNGPWRREEEKKIHRVLRAIGAFTLDKINKISTEIYSEGYYEDEFYCLSLFCMGEEENQELKRSFPKVPQVIWDKALDFIFERFTNYYEQKCAHIQWDCEGHYLWDTFTEKNANKEEFKR